MIGFKCWRNNNGAVYSIKRKSFIKNRNHLLGIPDIIGYRKCDGKSVYIEVKTGNDKLSLHQEIFIKEAKEAGCIAFVVKDFDSYISQIDKFVHIG